MCGLEPELRTTVLKPWSAKRPFAEAPGITLRSVPPLGSAARRLGIGGNIASKSESALKRLLAGRSKGKIWHSTYYSVPSVWAGFRVVTVYDLIYELFPDMYPGIEGDAVRDFMRQAVESADAVICISETTRQHVVETYGDVEDRTIVTYMGVSDVFRTEDSSTGETNGSKPFLLYVGARRGYKQFETLARAYGAWVGRQDTDLVVVGGAWTTGELELLGELSIGEKVRLLSGLDDATLAGLYRRSLALVFPSLYEGFGIPVVEAMSVGCPVVASRIPTTEEVADEVPIYFEPGRLESLHAALTTVAEGGLADARIRLGKQKAEQFSWERTATETLEAYRGL